MSVYLKKFVLKFCCRKVIFIYLTSVKNLNFKIGASAL